MEDSNNAITVQDFNGHILAWNNKALLIYGYSEEEALNSYVSIILPKEQPQEMQNIIKNLQSGILIKPFESIRKNKKGDILRV